MIAFGQTAMLPRAGSNRAARQAAAATCAVLLLLAAAAPATASRSLLLSEAESAMQGALRSLTATTGTSCLANTQPRRIQPTDPSPVPSTTGGTDPNTNGVPFSSLRSLGWDVPATRTPAPSADFWSVVCNSWGNVVADRTRCDAVTGNSGGPAAGVGEVHVRYNCTDQTLWMLTYAYANYTHTQNTGDMYAVYDCQDTTNNGAIFCKSGSENAADKFMQFGGTNGCNTACPTTNNGFCNTTTVGTSCWCCLGMWPVTDGAGSFVGWLGRARFSLPGTSNTTYSVWSPHINWGVGTAGNTGSAGSEWVTNGMCLECGKAPTPDPEPACNPPALTTTALTPTPVCTTQDSASLTFNITSDTAGTVTLTTTATNGAVCDAPASVPVLASTVTPVTFTCTQASGSGYDVTVRAIQNVPASNDCPASSSALRSATASVAGATSPPTVDVAAAPAGPLSVCADASFKELAFAVTSSVSNPTVQLTAPSFCAAVAATGGVIVNCTRPEAGWQTSSFDVRVNGSASAPPCAASDSDVVSVTVRDNPTVAIAPPGSPSVCADAAWKVFSFGVQASADAAQLVAVASPAANCAAGTPSGDVVLVNCTAPSGGWAALGGLGVSVTATNTDGCATTTDSTPATVAVDPVPTVSITGLTTARMCAQSGSPLTYTITSSTGSATVVATASENVTCTTAASGTTTTVTCKKSGGLPAAFTVTVTASTVNATSSCAGSATPFVTTVSAFCCGSGTAYARGNFGTVSSGLNATSQCFIPSLGNNWGWFSRLAGPGDGSYPIIMGAGQCKGGRQVGTLRVSCQQFTSSLSRVTFNMTGQVILGGVTPHAYVGCNAPTAGTPPAFGGSRAFAFTAATAATATNCTAPGCGDVLPAVVSAPQAMQVRCACSEVYWVFHQSSSFFTYSPTDVCV